MKAAVPSGQTSSPAAQWPREQGSAGSRAGTSRRSQARPRPGRSRGARIDLQRQQRHEREGRSPRENRSTAAHHRPCSRSAQVPPSPRAAPGGPCPAGLPFRGADGGGRAGASLRGAGAGRRACRQQPWIPATRRGPSHAPLGAEPSFPGNYMSELIITSRERRFFHVPFSLASAGLLSPGTR